jgi:hypothetical protein
VRQKIMMNSKNSLSQLANLVLVSVLTVGILGTTTSCNRKPNPAGVTPTTPNTNPGGGGTLPPANPGDDNNDGSSDLPQEPTDTPEPLPAPEQPNPDPVSPIIVRAIAKTTAYIMPVGNIRGTYVNIEVTWQPVNGAKEYWIFRNSLPTKESASKGAAYKIVKANGIASTVFYDGIMPPSFAGGNLWDKIKKGVSAVTIRPGVEYKYKVVAVDIDDKPITESDSASTVPLPPIAAPMNLKISETATAKPLFEWQASSGTAPDGYFVSVGPPIAFGQQAASVQGGFGVAYWSTFRNSTTPLARYGSQSDNMSAYPGTLPFDINFPLRQANRYSVSVTSVKTDTNDMRTAKAISKAWSESKLFNIGMEPAPVAPAPVAEQTEEKSSGILDKIKGIFGF